MCKPAGIIMVVYSRYHLPKIKDILRSCILFFNQQLWFVKEPQRLGFWLGFCLAIAECHKMGQNSPNFKVKIAAIRARVLRWSCPNPWHLATSAPAFSFFGAATGGTAASPTSGAEKTWFVCVLGVSGVPLPILVASSLYLVFTLKRLQTVIRLIKPACYFSASGCFGVLARCPGFGIFRQTQHFGLQKKKDSNCTKIILFKYL